MTIASDEAALGPKWSAGPTSPSEFFVPQRAIAGMQLRVPEERILEPLLLRKSKKRLDVRADVDFVLTFPEDGHERDRRNLLHERSVSKLGGPKLVRRPLFDGFVRRDDARLCGAVIAFPTDLLD